MLPPKTNGTEFLYPDNHFKSTTLLKKNIKQLNGPTNVGNYVVVVYGGPEEAHVSFEERCAKPCTKGWARRKSAICCDTNIPQVVLEMLCIAIESRGI